MMLGLASSPGRAVEESARHLSYNLNRLANVAYPPSLGTRARRT
jgi:hypothetical protein